MSDGPHRSLNMRKGWKDLSARAANCAYDPMEISDALGPAVAQDYRGDISPEITRRLGEIFNDQQGSLFKDDVTPRLESLRRDVSGFPLAQLLIDCAIQVANDGQKGADALVTATANALQMRAGQCARQVEEHYYRESTAPRAQNVRARIEDGIKGVSFNVLARQLLMLADGPISSPKKKSGLDDGVSL